MKIYKRIIYWLIFFIGLSLELIACRQQCIVNPSLTLSSYQSQITEEIRGVWLSTVYGLDWPAPSMLSILNDKQRMQYQQKTLIEKLDNLVRLGINTIFFQVKPDGTVLYRSDILPWSKILTGVIGKDPGYDPLEFILVEAHKRCLKVHAWLNPYRITLGITSLTSINIQPEWVRVARGHYVLDPGLPDVRNWIVRVVSELVTNYPIDGIHFDDYFYYETENFQLDDDITYQVYGKGFSNKADWRRNNTLLMVEQVSKAIKRINSQVVFGISPVGVWRNLVDDPRGSATKGGEPSYDTAYADTRLWVIRGLLDYIAPQIYWPVERQNVRYDVLARWWAELVRYTNTNLYIGIALYKMGNPTKLEPDWGVLDGVAELRKQLDINTNVPEINGTILFSESYLSHPQTAAAVKYLQHRWSSSLIMSNCNCK